MKKIFLAGLFMTIILGATAQNTTLYDFKATSLDGQAFDLSS